MKKILLALLLLLTVCGCSSKESAIDEENTNINSQETEIIFEKGLVEDGVYTNNFLNIKFTPTESMVISTEEEMLSLYDESFDVVKEGNDTLKNVDFNSLDIIYELMATDVNTGSNIQVMAEKVSLSNMTPKQYVNAGIAQLGNVDGFEVVDKTEPEDYDLCGITYSKSTGYITYSGFDLSETFLCAKVGDRMITMIITSMQDSDLDTFLNCFSPIEPLQ